MASSYETMHSLASPSHGELARETMCSRCHKLPAARMTYCQACVPHINVCGEPNGIVGEDALSLDQLGSGGDTDKGLVRCPNSDEGCEWTGELNQLENHLNPQPTTADNRCQFEKSRYKAKPQNVELHAQQLQEFKILVIVCVVLSLLAILVAGGLGMKISLSSEMNSDNRLRVMQQMMNEIKAANVEVETAKYNMQDQIEAIKQQIKVLKSSQSDLVSKYEEIATVTIEIAKELEKKKVANVEVETAKYNMQDQIEDIKQQIKVLKSSQSDLVSKYEEIATVTIEIAKELEKKKVANVEVETAKYNMQDQIEDIKQQIEVLKNSQSDLVSKCEEIETAKELERKHNSLTSQVVSLESLVSDLNSSQYVLSLDKSMKHEESYCTGYTTEKDVIEWIDEIELNQQVSYLILPQYRMPLLLRRLRQDNYIVSASFYTEYKGYRMRALAYPKNGSDSLRMVVCLCILQGKYDQTLQWPLNARFTVTFHVNETIIGNQQTEITFPSNNSSSDSFTDSTRNFFMIKDESCAEYKIKIGHNITATVFYLDVRNSSLTWWESTIFILLLVTVCIPSQLIFMNLFVKCY